MKVLAEIADIYPRMTSIHDSSLFDDSFAMDFINHGDKIIYCAMYLPGKKFFPAGLLVCLLMMAIFYSNLGSWKSFTLLLPLMRM